MAEEGKGSSSISTITVKFPAHGQKLGRVWNDGAHSHIKRIEICHSKDYIYSVRIEYIDENGKAKRGPIHGGYKNDEFTETKAIDLNYLSEFLTSIHGYTDQHRSLSYLSFETNNGNTHGPFCDPTKTRGSYTVIINDKGTKFSNPLCGEAKIVGFHGWSDNKSLNAIGVYVQPITKRMPQPQLQLQLQPQLQPERERERELELESHEKSFSLGEYGSEKGEYWEEKFRAIKRLVVYYDEHWIISIQIEYEDENGRLLWSKKHGGNRGNRSEVVLEDPKEYVVSIKGSYDKSYDSKPYTNRIHSLTVETNIKSYSLDKRQYRGYRIGTEFVFPTDKRLKVVGIHGRSDSYLNAIGLYVVRRLL